MFHIKSPSAELVQGMKNYFLAIVALCYTIINFMFQADCNLSFKVIKDVLFTRFFLLHPHHETFMVSYAPKLAVFTEEFVAFMQFWLQVFRFEELVALVTPVRMLNTFHVLNMIIEATFSIEILFAFFTSHFGCLCVTFC
jgi:hypothetical protein